jgi:hypothetical protein
MEFKKVISGFKRMCAVNDCSTCPLTGAEDNCLEFLYSDPNSVEEIIAEWLENNPTKTYLTEVLKFFPDTPLHPQFGFPVGFCPCDVASNRGCEHIEIPVQECLNC